MRGNIYMLFLFMIVSCNKFEKNINNHFNKFIFVDEYNEFKINNIKIIDTITITKNKVSKINFEILKLSNSIKDFEYAIDDKNKEINEIKIAKVVTKHSYVNGENFFYKTYSIPNHISEPLYENGKISDIKDREDYIESLRTLIVDTNSKIIKLKEERRKILEEGNNDIYSIVSNVRVLGYNADGEVVKTFQVTQDNEGKIKTVVEMD
ncbi:hypothetical protein PG616_01125 [Riemerella anatipestifer]|nr:hypothetical protein [Riemerella anatipestifer]